MQSMRGIRDSREDGGDSSVFVQTVLVTYDGEDNG